MKTGVILCVWALVLISCKENKPLMTVSVSDFASFVEETGYITDAERYGWSIVQVDVDNFRVKNGATWRFPNSKDESREDMPVTQVSYNDALSYCKWANARLPHYKEYWKLCKRDRRKINQSSSGIVPNVETNIVGNVWDITLTENDMGEIRLAGGSYFCNPKTCDGTNPQRELYVDKTTGNIHIGFSVVQL